MTKKRMVVFLFFFIGIFFMSTGVFSQVNGKQQAVPSSFTLVGSLDMGLQTGSVSRSPYRLFVGFFDPPPQRSVADFNADGHVNFSDFLLFAAGFGHRLPNPEYNMQLDLDGDGEVGFSDFLLFVTAFTG